jgi:hypothetical protein
MSFLTYESTRPWAKAMKQAVSTRKMPPWFADPHIGKFANDRTLSSDAIRTITAWADSGAPAGNPADAPPPLSFVQGWTIGQPDVVYQLPTPYAVPASGTIEYTYFVVPSGFTEDKWVRMAEARPGNRAVVHHMIVYVREKGSTWLTGIQPGKPFVPQGPRDSTGAGDDGGPDEFLGGYAPGTPPFALKPGQARLIKAGSDLIFQMHYTTNGGAATDQSRIGLVLTNDPIKERVTFLGPGNGDFEIPPGDPNYRVDADMTFASPVRLLSMQPHMHLRGKAFEYRVIYPGGARETLLKVPRYDFNWQLGYEPLENKILPPGAKLEVTAWYDNSPNNPFNPDPKARVKWGDQSWEEMMVGFIDVAFDPSIPKKNLVVKREKKK